MGRIGNWVLGGCSGIMAIGALFVAARSGYGVAYYGALAMFLFCVLFVFFLVRIGAGRE